MKKIFTFSICVYLLIGCCPLPAAEEGVGELNYAARDLAGRERWHVSADIKRVRDGIYLMVEKAEGVYSSFKGPVSWVAEMEFERTKDNVRPIRLYKRVLDAQGKTIRLEKQEFDFARKLVSCIHEEPANNIRRGKSFRLKRDAINRLSLAFYIKNMLENGRQRALVQMVSEEPNVYDMEIRVTGEETITLNGRQAKAYRISIEPELGLFNFVKVLLPKAVAWHSAVPGYEWLRYAGPEGALNSETVEVTIAEP